MGNAADLVLASFPSPPRGVWELDLGFVTLPLRAYALCIIVGIVVAIWWGDRRWVARGGTKGAIVDIAVWAVPFGLIGGRIYHVLTDAHRYFGADENPVDVFKIWDGGLGIWGAIAFGAVGAWLACRQRGIPLPAVADAIAPGIVVAQAIGRIGNYFNQELYGGVTDLPWGMEIFRRVSEDNPLQSDHLNGVSTGEVVQVVHPTFLYELLWNIGVALLIVWADRKFRLGHGRVFALYVAGYTAGRFWIEMMRVDDATHVLDVRINVWVAALVFLGAVLYFVLAAQRGSREAPESLRSADEPGDDDRPGDGDGAETEADDAESAGTDADTAADGSADDASAPARSDGTADSDER